MSKLLTIQETSKYLNVSQDTLRRWDKSGKLKSLKTSGGHRRYSIDYLNDYIGLKNEKQIVNNSVATYSRVSSHEQKQKGDLDRQSSRLSEYCAKQKYQVDYIIKDVGSGLSDTRKGFEKLMDLVISKKITKVVIEHKDRLTRFQYNLIDRFFKSYGVEIELLTKNTDISEEEEFVNDIMMLMASFSGKLYGKRSAKRRKLKTEEKNGNK